MSNSRVHHFKLVLLGDTAVGKSCLVVRFVRDEFFEFQEPTIGGKMVANSYCCWLLLTCKKKESRQKTSAWEYEYSETWLNSGIRVHRVDRVGNTSLMVQVLPSPHGDAHKSWVLFSELLEDVPSWSRSFWTLFWHFRAPCPYFCVISLSLSLHTFL